MAVQGCVHHARVHGVGRHWKSPRCELVLQAVREKHKSQLAVGIRRMGTVALPSGNGKEDWNLAMLSGLFSVIFNWALSTRSFLFDVSSLIINSVDHVITPVAQDDIQNKYVFHNWEGKDASHHNTQNTCGGTP